MISGAGVDWVFRMSVSVLRALSVMSASSEPGMKLRPPSLETLVMGDDLCGAREADGDAVTGAGCGEHGGLVADCGGDQVWRAAEGLEFWCVRQAGDEGYAGAVCCVSDGCRAGGREAKSCIGCEPGCDRDGGCGGQNAERRDCLR